MSYAGPPASRGHFAAIQTASPASPGRVAARPLPVPGLPKRSDRIAVFAAGILLGLAVGAGAALLFAPQAGDDTRRTIARGGHRLARRGHDAWDDLGYELRRAASRGRRAISGP
jgi:hypothetical protein